jgi:hypothetical protein
MLVRADTAGVTHGFVDANRREADGVLDRFDVTEAVRLAILQVPKTGCVIRDFGLVFRVKADGCSG